MTPKMGDFTDLIGVGGAACLDFINTVSGRETAAAFDRLGAYGDVAEWARATGLIPSRAARDLKHAAKRAPDRAQDCFAQAIALRDALYRVGVGVVRDAVAPPDLAALSDRLFPLIAASGFRTEGNGRISLTPQGTAPNLWMPLWFVAWSAFDVFTGDEHERLRQCDNSGCTWLFLDRSKNRSRRWCSMDQCGAIVKARVYRARRRAR